uniref:Nucleoporin Nup133/Nup155-like C-terminal domain-containing protein n=1 Tax=Romanomermis culicivorax TaxID=13658 RepID=A0A915KKZ2_ROMCU
MLIVENLRLLPQNGETRNALTKLNASLLDVTQLYTNYADEFNLSECKLAIVHCAGHNDPTLVENLWRDIIDSELALRQRDSTQVKAKLVADKIRNSIKLYLDSPKYLPMNFLIKYLFAKSVDNEFDPNWLTETLAPAGISYYELLSVLDSIFRQWTNTPAKKDRRLQIYILKAIGELVTEFTKRKSRYSAKEKSKMKSAFLDCCALYTVELETMPSGSETISMRQKFRDLQTVVENL